MKICRRQQQGSLTMGNYRIRDSITYSSSYSDDKKEIKSLLIRGVKPTYFKNHIQINGQIFNGFDEKEIEKMRGEYNAN